jgi:outer membrane protein
MKQTYLFFLLLSFCSKAQIQSDVLNKYINQGLENNTTLKTKQVDYQKATLALEQAQALFSPTVNFSVQYSLAAGGRNSSLPVGDLLNPVYNTLNQLTRTNNFPQIENTQINFLPNNFHDTKFRTTYPILNKDIQFNREIKKELIQNTQFEINAYKRELVYKIKSAYIQYVQAVKAVDIYKNAIILVKENLRVNEKLVANDVATKLVVYKAQSEVAKLEGSTTEADYTVKNAAAYFNFLLNKPLNNPIEIDEKITDGIKNPNTIQQTNIPTDFVTKRDEIEQLNSGIRIYSLQEQLNASYKTPKIGAILDLGFQGYGFKLWDKQAYALLGIQLDLPVYTAKSNEMKIMQSKLDIQRLDAQKIEVEQQLKLQAQILQNEIASAIASWKSTEAELTSTKEYYRLIEKKYNIGQALQIELIDARTQMTTAELKHNLYRFNILKKQVELERIIAKADIR